VIIEEVEDPLPVIDQALQADHEVGVVWVQCEETFTDIQNFTASSWSFVCESFCPH
jgi:hypothetical protein